MVSTPTPIPSSAIISSCAQMGHWRLNNAKTDSCLTARETSTITATTTGRLTVMWGSTSRCLSPPQDVNTRSASIQMQSNAQPRIWSAPTENLTSNPASLDSFTITESTDATGLINSSRSVTQKVSLRIAFDGFWFSNIYISVAFWERKWFLYVYRFKYTTFWLQTKFIIRKSEMFKAFQFIKQFFTSEVQILSHSNNTLG